MEGTPREGMYRSRFGSTESDPEIKRVRRRMARSQKRRRKVYQVTRRETGMTVNVTADSAQEACRALGLMIGECFIREVPGRR